MLHDVSDVAVAGDATRAHVLEYGKRQHRGTMIGGKSIQLRVFQRSTGLLGESAVCVGPAQLRAHAYTATFRCTPAVTESVPKYIKLALHLVQQASMSSSTLMSSEG